MSQQNNKEDKRNAQINALQRMGDQLFQEGKFDDALVAYRDAYDKLIGPKEEQEGCMFILVSIADVFFYQGKFEKATEQYVRALQALGGLANPYINLRIGQASFEMGDEKQASEYLIRTFMMEGQQIFMDEDPKYWAFLTSQPNYDPSVI